MTPHEDCRPVTEGSFWRLSHDALAAALARHDLSGEQLRVYLALADLTRGYSRERDVVSLSQIAEQAGFYYTAKADGLKRPDIRHVGRALKRLAELGLYGCGPGGGQSVTRWVVWPPPPMPTTAQAGSSATAEAGNGTTANATAQAGEHQDTKKRKTAKKPIATAKPPPDPRVKTFLDFFCKLYAETLGRPYIVAGGKDGATIKRLLAALDASAADALAELQQAARNMLADSWARGRADVGLLASKINSWRGNAAPEGKPPGSGFAPSEAAADYDALAQRF